jgi:hypothetical protein
VVERGPAALAGLSPERVAIVQEEIANGFRAAFATIAIFPALGTFMAMIMPVRRIESTIIEPPPLGAIERPAE